MRPSPFQARTTSPVCRHADGWSIRDVNDDHAIVDALQRESEILAVSGVGCEHHDHVQQKPAQS